MRLVTFDILTPVGPITRIGEWADDDRIVDLTFARALELERAGSSRALAVAQAEIPPDMIDFLSGGRPGLAIAEEAVAGVRARGDERFRDAQVIHERAAVRLRAPLPRPHSIRDFLMVEQHVRGAMERLPPDQRVHSLEAMAATPGHYKGNVDAVYGPDDLIPWPPFTSELDYELELGMVIGRGGKDISVEDAAQHIAGFTIFNDWSARDIQMREMKVGLGPGLGKDFANSLGPAIRTADGFDPTTAALEARVNGEVWSSGTVGAMLKTFAELVAWTSQGQMLRPGDVLGSGTIGGGCGLELGKYLPPGAVVELEAEGIGVLRNTVGFPA